MMDEQKRLYGVIKIEDRKYFYELVRKCNKTFIKIADIIFERNKNYNLLNDITENLRERGIIEN